jgi:adenosylmethionine-8-amino-7-oxononanoate aminotransferase
MVLGKALSGGRLPVAITLVTDKVFRQCGMIADVELRADRSSHPRKNMKLGAEVCLAACKHGLPTGPIRNVIVLISPFCITATQIQQMVQAVCAGIDEVCGKSVCA